MALPPASENGQTHHPDAWPPDRPAKEKYDAARRELFGLARTTLLARVHVPDIRRHIEQLRVEDLRISLMEKRDFGEGTLQERDRFALVGGTENDAGVESRSESPAGDAAEGTGLDAREEARYSLWMAFQKSLRDWQSDDVKVAMPLRIGVHPGLAAELINGMSNEGRGDLAAALVHAHIRGERDEDNFCEMEDGGVFPDWREADDPFIAYEFRGLREFYEQLRAGTLRDT